MVRFSSKEGGADVIELAMERIIPRLILVKVGELVRRAPESASGSRKP